MRIFISGATGFLGSYVAADLIAHGHEVAVLQRPQSNSWRLSPIRHQLTIVSGTLDDVPGLRPAVEAFRPEGIAHLGWEGVGNMDRDSPVQAQNVPHTLDLAALAVDVGARVFIGAGSQAEYGPYHRPIVEEDIPRPTTLYGMAKLAAGTMAGHMCEQHGLRFAWLRIFSTYGPKDAEYWLIPSLIRTLRQGRRMALTACEQKWGFLHARDAAAAFRIVLTNEMATGIFNLGSPDAPVLKEVVTRVRDLVNPAAELGFGEVAYRRDQVMVLSASVERLSALGWRPAVPLDEGLRETVEWYAAAQHS